MTLKPKAHVVVVDDDPAVRLGVGEYLESSGCHVTQADSCAGARDACRRERPDVAVLDYALPDGTALDLIQELKGVDPDLAVIVLTAHASVDLAVQAIKQGAENFLTKPVELASLLVVVERAIEHQRNRRRVASAGPRRDPDQVNHFLGESGVMRELQRTAQRLKDSELSVLILGETGSGKGMLARWLHDNSPRSQEAYIELNCAGLSHDLLESELFGHEKGAFTGATNPKTGLVELAHRGTMFLDEIGDMSLAVQPKLLKVLEDHRFRRLGDVRERTVDVRFIAATHQDLTRQVRAKTFRSDLYFRINTMTLVVPPLRERRSDIPILARHFLMQLAKQRRDVPHQISPDAEAALLEYAWPGNVRELHHVIERAVLLTDGDTIHASALRLDPAHAETAMPDDVTLEAVVRCHIERILHEEEGHIPRAAFRLAMPRSSLYQWIKKHRPGSLDSPGKTG